MKIVQEKCQVCEPYESNDDARTGWVSDKSARTEKAPHRLAAMLNRLPPGINLDDQQTSAIFEQPMARNRGIDSNRTLDVTQQSLREGYHRKKLRPTDDQHTRSNAFYDEPKVDGRRGFLERNNNLDRS
jgi:hypothetical protein